MKVQVFAQDGMSSDAAQKDFVHGHGLLEDGQIFPATHFISLTPTISDANSTIAA